MVGIAPSMNPIMKLNAILPPSSSIGFPFNSGMAINRTFISFQEVCSSYSENWLRLFFHLFRQFFQSIRNIWILYASTPGSQTGRPSADCWRDNTRKKRNKIARHSVQCRALRLERQTRHNAAMCLACRCERRLVDVPHTLSVEVTEAVLHVLTFNN